MNKGGDEVGHLGIKSRPLHLKMGNSFNQVCLGAPSSSLEFVLELGDAGEAIPGAHYEEFGFGRF